MYPINGGTFDVDGKQALTARIESEALEPNFWNDQKLAREKQESMARAKRDVQTWMALDKTLADMQASAELLAEDEDPALLAELDLNAQELSGRLDKLDFTRMLAGPHDRANCLLTIRPGAGGTESQDWAQMLLRMYTRWAERRGFKVELLDIQAAEEAGIKEATLKLGGEWAYGLTRGEKGVHRLVRISPFDSNARRHTSFASVEPFPEIDDDIEVLIEDKDLRIDVFRASGAGGQHINRTESAVRITHLPSGIVTNCQNDRSQIKNRETAMRMLRAKLYARALEEQRLAMIGIAGEKKDINFGSQIRNYVLHPYQMVKDVRSDHETSQAQNVLDGDLDAFIDAYLRLAVSEKAGANA